MRTEASKMDKIGTIAVSILIGALIGAAGTVTAIGIARREKEDPEAAELTPEEVETLTSMEAEAAGDADFEDPLQPGAPAPA
jgi:hypothetical protein